jgi:hypothetical protein
LPNSRVACSCIIARASSGLIPWMCTVLTLPFLILVGANTLTRRGSSTVDFSTRVIFRTSPTQRVWLQKRGLVSLPESVFPPTARIDLIWYLFDASRKYGPRSRDASFIRAKGGSSISTRDGGPSWRAIVLGIGKVSRRTNTK